jgi:putative intracellular protease/amidase
LLLGITHTLAETPSPDIVVVPGRTTTPAEMVDDEIIDWLRKVHKTTIWTVSVCTGALLLAAAGILKGLLATTHWYKMGVLRIMGAKPEPEERIVRSGKVVTAAGVSAGIDLALWLAGEIAGRDRAEAIQLTIEYDPHPAFAAGHWSKGSEPTRRLAKKNDGSAHGHRPAPPRSQNRLAKHDRPPPHREIEMVRHFARTTSGLTNHHSQYATAFIVSGTKPQS